MNTTIGNAIKATNQARQQAVEAKAASLIQNILDEQATVKELNSIVEAHRRELKENFSDLVDANSVLGGPLPTGDDTNAATINSVLDRMQKSREEKAGRLTDAIAGKQASIKACDERIAKLREEARTLAAETVTPASVMGS